MTLKEIEARMAEIKNAMNEDGADIEALTAEVDSLIEQRNAAVKAAESRSALLAKIASGEEGTPAASTGFGVTAGTVGSTETETATEKRAKDFVKTNALSIGADESRSLLLSTGDIATPTKVSNIQDAITGVSSIVDMVTVEDCTGMSADIVPYENTGSVAGDLVEGQAATESEGTFGTVEIRPTGYRLASYVSEEIKYQTPLAYTSKVQQQAFRALRRKVAEVVTKGIVDSELKNEITDIAAIDATTLRKIALSYGCDETVEGNAVLFLNKADLVAFGDVRGEKEKKAVYEITPDGANPNVGTIKDGGLTVRYCINSNCNALTGGTSGKATMLYGNPATVKLDLFGSYEVKTSSDYKFAEGLLSVLGTIRCGSALVVKNGFVVVTAQ